MLLLIEPHSSQFVSAQTKCYSYTFFFPFILCLRQRIVHYSAQYRRILVSFRGNRPVPFRGDILVPFRGQRHVPFRGDTLVLRVGIAPIIYEAPYSRSCISHPTRNFGDTLRQLVTIHKRLTCMSSLEPKLFIILWTHMKTYFSLIPLLLLLLIVPMVPSI